MRTSGVMRAVNASASDVRTYAMRRRIRIHAIDARLPGVAFVKPSAAAMIRTAVKIAGALIAKNTFTFARLLPSLGKASFGFAYRVSRVY